MGIGEHSVGRVLQDRENPPCRKKQPFGQRVMLGHGIASDDDGLDAIPFDYVSHILHTTATHRLSPQHPAHIYLVLKLGGRRRPPIEILQVLRYPVNDHRFVSSLFQILVSRKQLQRRSEIAG